MKTLERSAVIADQFSLAHKDHDSMSKENGRSDDRKNAEKFKQKKDVAVKGTGSGSVQNKDKKDIVCFLCGMKGHVKSKCRQNRDQVQSKKPVGLVSHLETESVSPLMGDMDLGGCKSQLEGFQDYLSKAVISSSEELESNKTITILRDTGALQSLLLKSVLPPSFVALGKERVLVEGIGSGTVSCPLETVYLNSELVKVAIVDRIPAKGVDMLLANDLAKGKVGTNPRLICRPGEEIITGSLTKSSSDFYPACVVTRSLALKTDKSEEEESEIIPLSDTFIAVTDGDQSEGDKTKFREEQKSITKNLLDWTRRGIILSQGKDPELKKIRDIAHCLDDEELISSSNNFVLRDDLLMRKYRPIHASGEDEWGVVYQIVVPLEYRSDILKQAHESLFSGHLGVNKTLRKIARNFYWPKLRKDVRRHCKTCHPCQLTGKPNQIIPKAPLVPIPVVEQPFYRIIIDVVGPLPRTKSGKEYIFTIMDKVTRFPEAIAVRSIKAPNIVSHLIDFFSRFSLPREIQSDQGSNFMGKYFKGKMDEFGIKHVVSTAYHPESQGALERFHQTIKSMLKKYCLEHGSDWDRELPFALFAIRSAPNESLGFSPFDLIFGHVPRGPLDVVYDKWLENKGEMNLLDYVSSFKAKLHQAWDFANKHLQRAQLMKENFDLKTKKRNFEVGQSVLVLLPLPNQQLKASFQVHIRF